MPSWRIHKRWEKIILGEDYGYIDVWIDSESKNIDVSTVREAFLRCQKSSGVGNFYPTNYFDKNIMKFYTEINEIIIREAVEALKGHDSWRIHPEHMCITLTYVYLIFGLEGLSATILHLLLDEIAKIKYRAPNEIREHIKGFFNQVINSLPVEDMKVAARNIEYAVLANLEEILRDILSERGSRKEISSKVTRITILYNPYSITKENEGFMENLMHIARSNGIKVEKINVNNMDCNLSMHYYWLVRKISVGAKIKLKPRKNSDRKLIDIDENTCRLIIENGILIIVEYENGAKSFYPHYTTMAGSIRYVPIENILLLL